MVKIVHLPSSRRKILFRIVQQCRQTEVSYANLIRRLDCTTTTTYSSYHLHVL